MATLLVEHTVDTSKSVLWSLDLHKVDWFTQAGASCDLGSIDSSSAGGDDLSTSSVDSICVQHYITHLHRYRKCSEQSWEDVWIRRFPNAILPPKSPAHAWDSAQSYITRGRAL